MIIASVTCSSGMTSNRSTPMPASFQPSSTRKVSRLAVPSQSTIDPMKPNNMISSAAMAAPRMVMAASQRLAPSL
ncbi:hypothetical protein D3C71_2209730 [compost metagenome]